MPGNLTLVYVIPSTNVNVTKNQFFSFSVSIRCTGGNCGNVTLVLDPKRKSNVLQKNGSASDADKILLKSRQFTPGMGIRATTKAKINALVIERVHMLIQLDHIPNDTERKVLKENGVELFSYIPNKAWLASISRREVTEILALPTVKWLGEILPGDKISSHISEEGVGSWAVNKDGTVNLTVIFFKDVSLDAATQIIQKHGGVVVGKSLLLNALTIILKNETISELANEDYVQWIEETLPPPVELNDGTRASIGVNTVQAAPYNLDGTNVQIGGWDSGWVDTTHDDFFGRVTIGDTESSTTDHATHVAGTMLGDGSLNSGQYRGMATNATVISYEWWNDLTELESEYTEAIDTYGIDISQNSWGFTYEGPDKYGRYDTGTATIDSVVLGNISRAIHIVWAAGNERPTCDNGEYDCIISPSTAKNTITVGAVDSNDDDMIWFSSWGPTNDGRLKPDIMAPGCEDTPNRDDGNPSKTIWSTFPGDTYYGKCGTSMAAPAVSGSVALMIEDYRNTQDSDPLPSTMKGLVIHTAKDVGNIGPDYSYGYGRINITAAVDVIRSNTENNNVIVEDSISAQGEYNELVMSIPAGQPELKVTLAWDDEPGTPNAARALVNDLDLIAIDTNGDRYYPWLLDPSNPSNPATTGADDLNNVEQIYVTTPINGIWKIRVNGSSVPNPAQNYSLISSNNYLTGGVKGLIPMNAGTPFYTVNQNPKICYYLTNGDYCNQTWQVNATGNVDTSWEFYVIYNSSYFGNQTDVINVTITTDTTPPTWDQPPTDQAVEANTGFTYDVNASDNVAIDTYFINDTTNFAIGASDGIITNNTVLNLGTYDLNISVNDTSNNL